MTAADRDSQVDGLFGRVAITNRMLESRLGRFFTAHGLTLGLSDVLAELLTVLSAEDLETLAILPCCAPWNCACKSQDSTNLSYDVTVNNTN